MNRLFRSLSTSAAAWPGITPPILQINAINAINASIPASRPFFTSSSVGSGRQARTSLLSAFRRLPLRWQHRQQLMPIRTRATDQIVAHSSGSRQYRVYNARRLGFFDRYPEFPLYAIIASNVGVFLLWTYANENYKQYRDSSWLRFMLSHFMLNEANAKERPWTVLTANFSHADLAHLGINMFVLHSFGTTVIATLGAPSFLALYTLCALGTSAASIGYRQYNEWRMRQRFPPGWFSERLVKASQPRGSLGASGCVMGTSVLFACLHPTATIYLMLVLPVPAWACVAGFMGYDLYRAANHSGGGTDVAGHLGGGVAGLAYWMVALRRGRGMRW